MNFQKIDRSKVVFINLTEMDKYDGLEQGLRGGGRHIEENGYGHEIFNFHNDNGKCYGYTPPQGTLNLKRISQTINQDALGEYIDDVLYIFTCTREAVGRIICGYYLHARVYAKAITDNRQSRLIISNNQTYAEYNIICDAENAYLIDRNDRNKLLPHSLRNSGVGHGQKSVWYADVQNRQTLINDLLDYVEDLVNGSANNDELKYHKYDESRVSVVTSEQRHRSDKAREECIRLQGCHCNICGFDFEKTYGEVGKDYIEVHHITPIGILSTAEDYAGTDPQNDLIPLCSNCHSMIHRRKEPYLPDEVKAWLAE